MKSAILRSGSFQTPSRLVIGSPKVSVSGFDICRSGSFSLRRTRSISMSPRAAAPRHIDAKVISESTIRRARSEADLLVSDRKASARICSPPVRVLEEEEDEAVDRGIGRGSLTAAVIAPNEVESSGGGKGRGVSIGGGGGGGGGSDRSESEKIENYYREMLRSDPSNPLLLRNYGKFLHEEGDLRGAEECYGRAILASPKDGDVLSLYGKLVWETHRDEERAGAYFQRAIEASPDDCYVLGSYASFLWDAENEDDEDEQVSSSCWSAPPALVKAF